MRPRRPWRRGFTLVELLVVIIVASATGTVFLERLRLYQELAEKAAMESTVRLIKTGLQIRLAELIVTNRQGQAAELETEDPTRWLEARPAVSSLDHVRHIRLEKPILVLMNGKRNEGVILKP